MTKQTINLGTPPKGSDGDTSRVAFEKTNGNFEELYARAQGKLEKDVGGGAGTIALRYDEAINGFIDLTGVLTGNRIVIVPVGVPQAYCVRNRTTGAFSLSIQSQGGTSIVISSGKTVLLTSDGADLIDPTPGRLIGVRVLTSSGTYTPTPGTNSVVAEVQGGGGGGACAPAPSAANTVAVGGGGAAGGYVKHRMTSGFFGVAFTIGAAGIGGAPGAGGGAGGASSFAGITAAGGSGGATSAAAESAYADSVGGGAATGGNIENASGASGGQSGAVYGSGPYIVGCGASSRLGSGGGSVRLSNGGVATGYGAGGGGTYTYSIGQGFSGGSGSQGVVIVWEYS